MDNEIHHRSFGQLFSDAIFFERLATEEKDETVKKRYLRASMLSTFLTLECAANCCLFCLNANNALIEDIDRLPPLSKLDLFALHGFKKKIDYSRNEVQKIKEIKHLRDNVVHPKVTKSAIGKHDEGDRSFACFSSPSLLTFSKKPKAATGIVSNSSLWSQVDCLSAIKSIVDFFNYFFKELLQMEKGLVFGLLNDALIIDGKPNSSIYPPSLFNEMEYLKSRGVCVKFMVTEP